MKMQFVIVISALSFHFISLSFSQRCDERQGTFHPSEETVSSTPKRIIASFNSPSELACSQKCFYHDKCKYKKFNAQTRICELLESSSDEDFLGDALLTTKEVIKKEQKSSSQVISKQSCGGKCTETTDTDEIHKGSCDCKKQGVYESCQAALSANNFQQAIYWIFPPSISTLMAVECMRDSNGKAVTIIHHDSERATLVTGFEAAGSYNLNFRYDLQMESIIAIINQSSFCQQQTNITCYHVSITCCVWINGRRGQKLDFIGGGPSNGTGCACGITNTCAEPSKKCNCDKNDQQWRMDEGYVTYKDVLPITAMHGGDTGDARYNERLIYTVGPLICIS